MILTEAARKYVVKGARIRKEKRGSVGFPYQAFEDGREPEEAWFVYLDIQHGLLPIESVIKIFEKEREATEYIAQHPCGSEFKYSFLSDALKIVDFDEWVKQGWFPISTGGPNSFMVFDTLKSAGITDSFGIDTEQQILDSLGPHRVKEIMEKYGENWQAVARFQYCLENLPHSSPAYIAAAHDFCYYILEDDFKAGYLLRDLEVLLHEVEQTAARTIATRQKAGQSGSRKSAQAREKRRAELFEKITTLVERNPDIAKFGEEAVAKLACDECARDNASLWKQGRGQVSDYLGEIRRGEAGPDLQERYQAIFGSKPPKRFRG